MVDPAYVAPLTQEFREVAVELFDEFCPQANCEYYVPGSPITVLEKRCIFLPTNLKNEDFEIIRNAEEIRQGMVSGLMIYEAPLVVPAPGHYVKWQNRTLYVYTVDYLAPTDGVILYTILFKV